MKSNIVILILRSKQSLCCDCVDKSLDVCIFARFKANCEVMPLRSFANFKLKMSRYSSVSQPFLDTDYFWTSINLRGLKID